MNRRHSLLALAICLPLTATKFSPTPATPSTEHPDNNTATSVERMREKWLEGTITSWHIEEGGQIVLHLKRADGSGSDWMRTASNQSSTTQFELLVLHAVLALDSGNGGKQSRLVRVRVESSTSRDGDKPKDALRLTAIGSGK